MNMALFERAEVAAFAYRRARHTGALDCMKALCYVIRNRMRAGWGDGTWTTLIEQQVAVEGNVAFELTVLNAQDRLLQMMVRDVDDIYLGSSEDATRAVVQDALFFHFIDKPATEWFVSKIMQDTKGHPRIAQVGTIALFK